MVLDYVAHGGQPPPPPRERLALTHTQYLAALDKLGLSIAMLLTARTLNARAIATPTGAPWSAKTVTRVQQRVAA